MIIDKEVILAGLGQLYNEVWEAGATEPLDTSCLTTNEGPIDYHYRPCDIHWVDQLESKNRIILACDRFPNSSLNLKKLQKSLN